MEILPKDLQKYIDKLWEYQGSNADLTIIVYIYLDWFKNNFHFIWGFNSLYIIFILNNHIQSILDLTIFLLFIAIYYTADLY